MLANERPTGNGILCKHTPFSAYLQNLLYKNYRIWIPDSPHVKIKHKIIAYLNRFEGV
jgi:hypothetical protein